jgi:O-antigen/teichoic acid export membrane protein
MGETHGKIKVLQKIFNFIRELFKNISENEGLKKYGANTLWLFLEQFLRLVLSTLIGIWVIRYLQPENYGALSYVVAFNQIAYAFSRFGLDGLVVREIIRNESVQFKILGTSFWIRFLGSFLIFLLFIPISYFVSSDFELFLFITLLNFGLVLQSFDVVDFYYLSKVQAKYISIRKLIQLFLISIFKIYLILAKADLFWFVFSYFLDSVSLAFFSLMIYKSQKLPSFFKFSLFDVKIVRSIMKDAFPLFLASALNIIQAKVDQIMILKFLSKEELGYYSSAMRLIEFFGFIPMVVYWSFYTSVERTKVYAKEKFEGRLRDLYRLMTIAFILTGLPILFFGKKIILFLYGSSYEPAGILLSLMSFRLLFTYFGVIRGIYLLTENLTWFGTFTMFLGAISNVLFNIIFLPLYGAVGAIISFMISLTITVFLVDIIYQKTRYNIKIMFEGIIAFFKFESLKSKS